MKLLNKEVTLKQMLDRGDNVCKEMESQGDNYKDNGQFTSTWQGNIYNVEILEKLEDI